MKTLVVVSHMDDESFGLGGTLIRLCQEDPTQVKVLSICNGRDIENKIERQTSFMNNMNKLGCSCSVLGYDDLSLPDKPLHVLSDQIKEEIDKFEPERVITNSISDIHQDHVITSKATRIACRPYKSNVKVLQEFKIPCSSGDDTFNIAVDITGVINEKIEMCCLYQTELCDDGYKPNSLIGIRNVNRGDGILYGIGYIELLRDVWRIC